ncbi:M12 family metallopeptidase [Pseudomonas sp. P2758]|uniref:M12 family metallopeptidase n=1 Tax=unclassified Pseudomonas TaxID=196821 RepID=UPI003B5AA00D
MCNYKPCVTLKAADPRVAYQVAVAENGDNALPGGISIRAVAMHKQLWAGGRVLTIAFLGRPSEPLKEAVRVLIREWEPYVNLSFDFIEGNNADIKIQTNADQNGSLIGTDALTIKAGQPTMLIKAMPGDFDFRTVVLHEFGHALGLHHEHLHLDANIPWNKEKVYEEYATKYGMSKEEVDVNLLNPLSIDDILVGVYDTTSIMHYPVEKELTNGVFEVPMNTDISSEDKRVIQLLYPIAHSHYDGSCEHP